MTESNQTIQEIAKPIRQFEISQKGGHIADIVAVPRDYELRSTKGFIDETLPAPRRRKGISYHATPDSLSAHLDRYKSDTTVLFADFKATRLTAVYNYNPAGGEEDKALFGDHRAVLNLEKSEELKKWEEFCAEEKTSEQMSYFFESRAVDLIDLSDVPEGHQSRIERINKIGGIVAAPNAITKIIPTLKIVETSVVQNTVSISSGECDIIYKNEHAASDSQGEKMTVPGWFLIAIPLFKKGFFDTIPVRLRYRKKSGVIYWSCMLLDIEKYTEDAYEDLVNSVATAHTLPLFNGNPE